MSTVGAPIGKAFVAGKGRGLGTVYAEPEHPKHVTIQIDRTGERLFRSRANVSWRKSKEKPMKTVIAIGKLGKEQVLTTVDHLLPLSDEWLAKNGAVIVPDDASSLAQPVPA